MKKVLLIVLVGFVFMGLVFMPGCKSAASWNPLGTWNVNLIITSWGHNWYDVFTFTGNDSGGAVSGLTPADMAAAQTGTWTKTGDYSISMNFDWMWGSLQEVVTLSGSSSEASPNSMSGSGTWTEVAITAATTISATRM
jgi:hypothetical protein